jgi:hypothetical protein
MIMGLSDADYQGTEFRRHEMLREAQQRRSCADDGTPTSPAWHGAVRSRLGSLLIRAGRILAWRAPHVPAGGVVSRTESLDNASWPFTAPGVGRIRGW